MGVFYEATMVFHRLSPLFYQEFGMLDEILTKEDRPYYVLILKLDGLTYAIPLRSNINHTYCFIADKSIGQNNGLDYSKAVVIIDNKFIDTNPVTIRQNEFNVYKKKEHIIKKQFSSYVARYKKEILRRIEKPSLPISSLCRYSSLKHFHQALGL